MSSPSRGAWAGVDETRVVEEPSEPADMTPADGPPQRKLPKKERRTSLRARVALLVAAAVGIAVALASVAAYVTVRHELRSHLDSSLEQRALATAQSSYADPDTINQLHAVLGLASDIKVGLAEPNGAFIAYNKASAPPFAAVDHQVAAGTVSSSVRTGQVGNTPFRVVSVQVHDGLALVVAQSLTDTNQELGKMALVMFTVGIGGIVVAAIAGLGIAREGLRPVERLTAATEHIARTDDLTPIPVRGTDELARLTSSFNSMLGALGQSRDRQRQLIADAGHELRTPLTSLRTNFDLLAQSTTDAGSALAPQDRVELMADVRAQLEELSALVGDLVELARSDNTPGAIEPLDLAAVLDHTLQRARRRAPGLTFDVTAEPWEVMGDATSLERAVMNLLDNAAKWSPPAGMVTVTLHDGILQVGDEGPGIAEADMPHVFERFYRATDARGLPGSGLGLSIVRQAAERHGGFVNVSRSRSGGALLTMGIPGQRYAQH